MPGPARIPRAPPKSEGDGCGSPGCAIGDLMKLLGKTHVLGILYLFHHAGEGPRRFVDIQKELHLSPNTLSDRLKELVEAGLLTRTAYNEIPPRVDYAITPKARDLKAVFDSLVVWSQAHNLEREPVPAPTPPAAAKA